MAGRFTNEKKADSQSRLRDDPKVRASLKPPQPVVVLQGQKTMSSGESFAAMLARART